jgi:hypothetical protein
MAPIFVVDHQFFDATVIPLYNERVGAAKIVH